MAEIAREQPSTGAPNSAARRLANSFEEIAERWEQRLRRELPAARGQSHPDLINTLPRYLEQLSLALATRGANSDALQETCRSHAADRAQQSTFSLEQLLIEYTVLHETILDVLERDGRLSVVDDRVLLEANERGMKDAASEYVRVLRAREVTISEEAQHARIQIDTLLQGATDGVVTVDLERRYIYMNDEGASILSSGQKTKEELLGKTMMEEPPEPLGDRFFWAQLKALEQQTPVQFEDNVTALGRWLQIRVYPSESGLNIYCVREEVLATVSHDLRNPLGSIHASADLLAMMAPKDASGDALRKQSSFIHRAARRMERLISDLLDVAKIEAGRFAMERRVIDADALLQEVMEAHEPVARQRSIHLATAVSDGPCELLGDRDRLLQVFANLVGNALKFTPEGGNITLRLDRCGDEVELSVQDTGPGISAIDRAHIFERYWQGQPTTKKGTGLGLFIARNIIEAHGGKIWIESEGDAGCTFRFTVPSAAKAESQAA